ncbi:MAG: response regulator [Opitutus sp.]|nr:response regulator [Opitutus sp.]
MKILIIDDDPVSRAVLQKILADQPEHQTTVAEEREAGWALLDDPTRYFDVVFLDISMPGMDGLQLLQGIRQSPFLRTLEVVM